MSAAFVAIVLSPFTPAGVPVLAAGLTAVAVGWGRAPREAAAARSGEEAG